MNPNIDIENDVLVKCDDISLENLINVQQELRKQEMELDQKIEKVISI
ncbi:MAG: hypothetical protein HXK66_00595 [Clostridiales bacterium]|jgi:hypothetical protein|nr:hypothetical protein [Clostridiales bacterium]